MNDYKAAYERERAARKHAEELLETKSLALYQLNEQLQVQYQQINSEFQQKSLLINIARYSQEELRLSELLPELIESMLSLAKLPFGLFDYYPVNIKREAYRSLIFTNPSLASSEQHKHFDSIDVENKIGDAIDMVSVEILYQRGSIYYKTFNDDTSPEMAIFKPQGITGLLAIPIVANDHTAAIIYLFVDNDTPDKEALLKLFEANIKQLGILIEHRYNQEQLEENYQALKNTLNELSNAQRQLVQSEKMASIGQLSAGIAHEINNPIGYIKSNLHTLGEYLSSYRQALNIARNNDSNAALENYWQDQDLDFLLNDASELLAETRQGIERVTNIISGLKSFARASNSEWEDCSIEQCITEAVRIAHNTLKYNCTLQQDYQSLPSIRGVPGELVQVFLNLVINAAQSIEEKGEITISTRHHNTQIEIRIADNGCGIPADVCEKIFDPFYTTKPVGEGTGLGLSITFGIVEKHGGTIEVDSEEGKGTTFIITLPTGTNSMTENSFDFYMNNRPVNCKLFDNKPKSGAK